MKLIDNNDGMSTVQFKILYRIVENNLEIICLDPKGEVYSVDKKPSNGMDKSFVIVLSR